MTPRLNLSNPLDLAYCVHWLDATATAAERAGTDILTVLDHFRASGDPLDVARDLEPEDATLPLFGDEPDA
jgi:hypothetical protein